MAYQPDEDPFAQVDKKGPHNFDVDSARLGAEHAKNVLNNLNVALARVASGHGPGADMAMADAQHAMKWLARSMGFRLEFDPRQAYVSTELAQVPDAAVLTAAGHAIEGYNLLVQAPVAPHRGPRVSDARLRLINAVAAIDKAVPPPVNRFASYGAGGAVTGGRT